jgi:tyrosine-protein kinase Etk/Wzc
MEDQISKNKSELWNLSVRDIFYKYVRFLPLFLLSLAFALLIAWVYLRYATRIYGASGSMLIKNEQHASGNDKVKQILEGDIETQTIQTEMEILRSRPLMERVVNRLQLQFTYTAIGKIKELNMYNQGPFLVDAFEIKDSTRGFLLKIKFINNDKFRINNGADVFNYGQVFTNEYGVFRLVRNGPTSAGSEYTVSWQPAPVVASYLVGAVRVAPKTPGTTILAVSIQTTNPQMAADIVNNLMVQYDSMTVEQNNYSTDQMLKFVDDRLAILNREIDSIQLILLAYQNKHKLVDVDALLSNYFEKIKDADKVAEENEAKLSVANLVSDYVQAKNNQYSSVMVPSSLGLEDVTLNSLIDAYNKAQMKRQGLLDSDVPLNNPAVKETEGQIEELRTRVIENLRNIKIAFSSAAATLRAKSRMGESELQAIPYVLKEYVEIQRQVKTKEELYSLLEGKREEAAISRAATLSNSKVIDMASTSNTPVKPNKRAIQILAILIGVGLPAILIFISEVVNDKVSTRFDIEKITSAPILGEVGHSYSDKTLIVNKTSRSMVAEQFRIVRSNLQYILPKIEKPIILVTSSFSGEGKSFVSTNMGSVLALTGKKTVILEFDIRKPKVLVGLNMSKKPGISNFLLGKSKLEDLIIQVPEQENLYVLPCGPIPPNPSELLLDPKVNELFEWLRINFDVILIDTAPVGMVSDAMTLGKYADCTLYLVRQGHTFKKQVALIDEFYKEKKLPKVSIVINDVKVKPGYGYYGYGRYGYGYGYGQKSGYYEEETPPVNRLEKFMQKVDPRRWLGLKKKKKRSNS